MASSHRHEVRGWKATVLSLAGSSRRLGMFFEWAWWARAMVRSRLRRRRRKWWADRLDPNWPFPEHLRTFIDECPPGPVRVLDVGSGPFTVLGTGHPERKLDIVATDPLARSYNLVISALRIKPIVRARRVAGEDLVKAFGEEAFDFTHARNSLDHGEDPVRIVLEMLRVTKTGRVVFLQHHPDEAEDRGHTGLHRWNLSEEDGHFLIWSHEERVDVTELLTGCADVTCERTPVWVEVTIRKRTASVPARPAAR